MKISNLKKIIPFYTKYKVLLILTIILSWAYAGLGVLVPILEGNMLSNFNNDIINNVYEIGKIAILLLLTNFWMRFIIQTWSIVILKLNAKMNFDLKSSILESLLKLQMKNFDKTGTGVFISRINKDSSELSELFDYITDDISVILMNISFVFYAYFINIYLGLFLTITIVIVYLITNMQMKRFRINDTDYRMKDETVIGSYTDLVKGIRDVKNLGLEKNLVPKIGIEQMSAINSNKKKIHTNRSWKIGILVTLDILNLIFVALSMFLILQNKLSVANFLIIYIYKNNVNNLINATINLREKLVSAEVAASRVFDIIEYKSFEKEKFGKNKLEHIGGEIEFKSLDFKYEDHEPLFKNLTFNIKPNSMVAFVGKSGEGKSTILDLICKSYMINSGEILIDGYEINTLSKNSIKDNITIVTQEPYIFNMSFKDNIRIANKNATDEQIIEVCKRTVIHDFIMSKEDGYDTLVGESGVMLSGGQKQRLAIARALIKKSKIILFDEATSSLDNQSQEEIKKMMKELAQDHTIIIVAHRLSTIVDADKIYVIKDHQILQEGTHEELMNSSEFYNSLYKIENEVQNI